MARETFEHGIIPWAGRPYAEWIRAWARLHPADPAGMVQVPSDVFEAYQGREPGVRLNRSRAEALGYPGVPGEGELDRVRRELKAALHRCDWDEAHDLDRELRDLQERVAALRLTALKPRAIGA